MATKHIGKGEGFRKVQPERQSLEYYASKLPIEDKAVNELDLDEALIQQPELYWHVADAVAVAISERDGAKLDFESGVALADGKLRTRYDMKKERVTEGAVKQELAADPKLISLERQWLSKKLMADRWEALHQAFRQRSYALRGLADRSTARMNGNKDSAYDNLAGKRREAAGQERRRMRGIKDD